MGSSNGIRAGRAYVELFAKSDQLEKALKGAQAQLRAFGEMVSGIGRKMMMAGASIVGPLLAVAKLTGGIGEQFSNMANRTGVSVEALSELDYVASQTGTSIDMVETGVRKMQKTLADASDGSKEAADSLEKVGLSATQLQGLSPDKQFVAIADAIGKMPDPTQRAAAAMDIFGKSGTELLPMMAEGASGINKLAATAHRLGIVFSTDDVLAAGAFNDKLDELWKTVRALGVQLGVAIIPMLTTAANAMEKIISPTIEWVRQNRAAVVWTLAVGTAIAATGAAAYVAGTALTAAVAAIGAAGAVAGAVLGVVSAGAEMLAAAVAVLLTPVGASAAALAAMGVALAALAAHAAYSAGVFDPLISAFKTVARDAATAFQGISDALAAGNVGLAARVFWAAIELEFERGKNAIYHQWVDLREKVLATPLLADSVGLIGSQINVLVADFELLAKAIKFAFDIGTAAAGVFLDNLRTALKLLSVVAVVPEPIMKLVTAGPVNRSAADSSGLAASDKDLAEAKAKLASLQAAAKAGGGAGAGASGKGAAPGGDEDGEGKARTLTAFVKQQEQKIHELRIGMIEDEETRELASITLKYDTEREEAMKAGADVSMVEEARRLELDRTVSKFRKQHEDELAQLQEEGIVDAEFREVASIRRRYAEKISAAEAANGHAKELEEEREQAIHNVQERFARQRMDANKGAQYELEQLEIERTMRGHEKEMALLELERKKALEREADPETRTGVDPDTINKIFDAKEALSGMHQGGAATGTFSAAAAQGMFGGSTQDHIKRTAVATEAIAKAIKNPVVHRAIVRVG